MDEQEIFPTLARVAGEAPVEGLLFYVRSAEPEGRLLEVEGDAVGCLGHPLGALRRDPLLWSDSLHPEDLARVAEAGASLEPGAETTLEYRVITAADGVHWVRDTVRRSPSRPEALVGIMRDVTAERRLRDRVAALEERIWRAQRLDSLGALAAGVAHDFNNLLMTILSSVGLLEQEPLSSEAREDLSVIREASLRGSRMVRQILRFARRGEEFSPELLDLGGAAIDLRAILERTLGSDYDLRLRAASGLPRVRLDQAQIEQVILNLVVNARDAMPTGGTVDIRVERREAEEDVETETSVLPEGEYVVLSVRDTGTGIPEEVRKRIFTPFFTTKSGDAAAGSGFGLSTVQRIVRGYGGGVAVTSAPGRGTTFEVWLPTWDRATGLPEVVEPSESAESGRRVLVVEPDRAVREVVLRTLGRDGHHAVAVGDATEALRVFDRGRPAFDLAVVALALPDRPGRTLARALTRRVPALPVILVAGEASSGAPAAATEDGVVLDKPFSPEQLRAAVARAVGGDRGSGGGGAYEPSLAR